MLQGPKPDWQRWQGDNAGGTVLLGGLGDSYANHATKGKVKLVEMAEWRFYANHAPRGKVKLTEVAEVFMLQGAKSNWQRWQRCCWVEVEI